MKVAAPPATASAERPSLTGRFPAPTQWRRRGFLCRLSVCVCAALLALDVADAGQPWRYSIAERRSGYTYLSEDNQRLQDDDFANPGLLWVERGHDLWQQIDSSAVTSCARCHGDATPSMRGVRTRYPRFDPQSGKLINLEQQINRCRAERMHAPSYPYESDALLALTTFVALQSRGLPIDVRIDGPAQPFFAAGKALYLTFRTLFRTSEAI